MLTRKKLQRHLLRLCFEQTTRFFNILRLVKEIAEKTKWAKE